MLKKMLFVAAFIGSLNLAKSQQIIDLEELSLPPDSFWNGSDNSGSFVVNQLATFPNSFVDWGGGMTSWSGFAYSNMLDTITQSFSNQYSCIAGEQLDNSQIFGINYNSSDWNSGQIIPNIISFSSTIQPVSIYVTNSTYTALTIKNGDSYSKKFGGDTGNDPDWFKLTITGMLDSTITGIVDFYLADYRFSNNNQDYIVKEWQNIDLSNLGSINKIAFSLSSSDTGMFGMNTPAYFCFDNIVYSIQNTLQALPKFNINVYPIPSSDIIYFTENLSELHLFNLLGQEVFYKNDNVKSIDISHLPSGKYILKAHSSNENINKLIIKN